MREKTLLKQPKRSTATTVFIGLSILALTGTLAYIICEPVKILEINTEEMKRFHPSIRGQEKTEVTEQLGLRAMHGDQELGKLLLGPTEPSKEEEEILRKNVVVGNLVEAQQYSKAISETDKLLASVKSIKSSEHSATRIASINQLMALFYDRRGYCNLQLKNYREGIDDLSTAIAIGPPSPSEYRNRGLAYKLFGKQKEADADLAKARQTPTQSALWSQMMTEPEK